VRTLAAAGGSVVTPDLHASVLRLPPRWWRVMAVVIAFAFAGCGGQSTSPTAPSGPPAPALTVYEPGPGVSLPTLIREVKPAYTAQAVAARIQGVVRLSVVVLANGGVGDVTVTQSLDTRFGLDTEAVTAARQWIFSPGMKDGVAVAVRVTIEMTFTLV
jgi:TonB family protein